MDEHELSRLQDIEVRSDSDEKLGSVKQIYRDDETGQPSWVTVKTGWFGGSETFVPLDGAQLGDDVLRVPQSKAVVNDAPRIDPDGHLSPQEEQELFRHYGIGGGVGSAQDLDRDHDVAGKGSDQRDRGHRNDRTDEGTSVTRSEERLNVGKQEEEAGRVRLRKYVTTEEETVTVPVRKEKARVERHPVEGDAHADPIADDDSEHVEEVVLREERPVVNKETVAVEEVSIGKEAVTEDHTVTEEVRKEHVDVDGDDVAGNERRR